MPGLKIVVGPPDPALPPAPAPEAPAPEIHRHRRPVFSAPGIDASFDVPDDYPSFSFANEEFFLFVEGLVYDRSDEDLVQFGAALAAQLKAGDPIDAGVLGFLRHADGDFVVLLVHKPSGTVVVFNDRWGRLPLYAAQTSSQFLLGREPVELLPHLGAIRFDRKTLVEWLAFEFALNDKWVVEGVDRVAPASLFLVSSQGDGVRAESRVLEVRDLTASEPVRNRRQAVRGYVERYLQGYAARIRKLGGLGYRLTSDLSGGFDTRMLFAAACRLDAPVEFYTDELVTGDESEVALRLAAAGGRPAVRVACPEWIRDADEWRRWVYLTGGRVNCNVMTGSLLPTRARRALISGKTARFMGFAGEAFRCPPLPAHGYGGFDGALAADVYTRYVGFRDGCALLGLDWQEYRRHLADTVARWPERDLASQCRRLDMRWYMGICNAGEDRHRWHFWTVSPMWANDLLDFAYRRIVPRLSNVVFFTELLRAVYPKVLEVPLHNRPIRLASRLDVTFRWLKGELVVRVRQHRLVRGLRRRLGDPEKWAARPSAEERAWIREQVRSAFRESAAVRATFGEAAVTRYLETQHAVHRLHQILTAVWFVAEVDRRFPGRASGPEIG